MSRLRLYKYIFIDLDDTLWDFHANAYLSLQEVFDTQNLHQYFSDFDHFFKIYAKRNLELWELYGKGLISREFLMIERFRHPLIQMGVKNDSLAESIGTLFLDILPTKTTLIPHAIDVLESLYDEYPLTLISNGFSEIQHKKLRNANLNKYFTHIVLSESAKALKPDRRIFEYAMQLNMAEPSECIMIGDSYQADIQGAKNAGIDQVYFNTQSNVNFKDATYGINDLRKIREILRGN